MRQNKNKNIVAAMSRRAIVLHVSINAARDVRFLSTCRQHRFRQQGLKLVVKEQRSTHLDLHGELGQSERRVGDDPVWSTRFFDASRHVHEAFNDARVFDEQRHTRSGRPLALSTRIACKQHTGKRITHRRSSRESRESRAFFGLTTRSTPSVRGEAMRFRNVARCASRCAAEFGKDEVRV